jgi:hypothetical protein
MNEQQRAEYMAIVAAIASSETSWGASSAEWITSCAMETWVAANKEANEAKP